MLSTAPNFPAGLDSFPLVQPGDTLATNDEEHDLLHNLIVNTIVQIEQKLGINSSVSSQSIDYIAKHHQHQGTDNSAQLSRLPIRMTAGQSLNPLEVQDSGAAIRSAITAAGEFLDVGPTASSLAIRSYVSGDTQDRWQVQADGTIKWGPGAALPDVTLSRWTANGLSVGANLQIAPTGLVQPAVTIYRASAGASAAMIRSYDETVTKTFEVQSTGSVFSSGASSYFGPFAMGGSTLGTRLRTIAAGDVGFIAESDASILDVGMIYRTKGAGLHKFQGPAAASTVTINGVSGQVAAASFSTTSNGGLVDTSGTQVRFYSSTTGVSAWLNFPAGITMNSLTTFMAGADVSGSPNGYTAGELRWRGNTTLGSSIGVDTVAMYFDHRTSNSNGNFYWRTNVGGGMTNAATLSSSGLLALGSASPSAIRLDPTNRQIILQGDVSNMIGYDTVGNPRWIVGLRSDVSGNATDLVNYTYSGLIRFYPSATEKMRMSNTQAWMTHNDVFIGAGALSNADIRLWLQSASSSAFVVAAQANQTGNASLLLRGQGTGAVSIQDGSGNQMFNSRGPWSSVGNLESGLSLLWNNAGTQAGPSPVKIGPATGSAGIPGSARVLYI
jgi:hypothetical protein